MGQLQVAKYVKLEALGKKGQGGEIWKQMPKIFWNLIKDINPDPRNSMDFKHKKHEEKLHQGTS